MSVTAIRPGDGSPRCASSMVGSVVTSKSSMILGLVSANSARAIKRADRLPASGESPLAAARPAAASGSALVACVTRCPPCLHSVARAAPDQLLHCPRPPSPPNRPYPLVRRRPPDRPTRSSPHLPYLLPQP